MIQNADKFIDNVVGLARKAYPGYHRSLDCTFDHEEPKGKWRLTIYNKDTGTVVHCFWESSLVRVAQRLRQRIRKEAAVA